MFAQNQLDHEKRTYTDSVGKLYWNRKLPVYLWLSAGVDAEKHRLESNPKKYADPFYFDKEGLNVLKTPWAVDKKTRKAIVPNVYIQWEVIADGVPPVTKALYKNASHYFAKKKHFYGGGLNIELSSIDKHAGVEKIYSSLNNKDYTEYTHNIPITAEGEYKFKYYSTDNVGNAGKANEYNFTLDISPPETFHTIVGITVKENIISSATKIYLEAEDKLSGLKKTYYQFNDGKEILYNKKTIPISLLPNGEHTLTYYSVDHLNNKETPKKFDFYLDKFAPILTSDVLGDRYIVSGRIYFSGRTKLKLTAVDNKSGVKSTKYSVDNSEFKEYKEPFYLPSVPGIHVVKYYAVDNTENKTVGYKDAQYEKYKHKVEKIYVDLTGPSIKFNFTGQILKVRDTIFINKNTKISLNAFDNESGLQYISYSLDDDREEIKYTSPICVNKNGFHKLEYFGYDNVNNRNRRTMFFYTDNYGPEPEFRYSIKPIGKKDSLDILPDYAFIYLSATDDKTGTKEIYYSLNGSIMKRYLGKVFGFKKNAVNKLKIKAVDKLGNEGIIETSFYVK